MKFNGDMIKAIAIDDEANALGIIQQFCDKIADIKLVACFTNPLLALPYCKNSPDVNLVFLDIQMSQLNGLKLAEDLSRHKIKIILTTAYPNYAIDGYELDVIDYLLKPISFQRFERALNKYRSLNYNLALTNNENDLKETKEEFMFVRTNYTNIKLFFSDIYYIEGFRNYVKIHTAKKIIISLINMKNIEETLRPHKFIRVHKSYIVPFRYIETIGKDFLKIGNKSIPIGESYKEGFSAFMKGTS